MKQQVWRSSLAVAQGGVQERRSYAHSGVVLTFGVAAISVLAILFATALLWPIPHLGFVLARDGMVEQVEPNSPAAVAGLQVGDRIRTIYDHPFTDVIQSVRMVTVIPPRDQPVAVTVERAGQTVRVLIPQPLPDAAFQRYKLAVAVLAVMCWGGRRSRARRGAATDG